MLPSLALAAAFALPQPAPLKLDRFGDPLPPGALARFGTLRFTTVTPTLPPAFSPDGVRAAMRTSPDFRLCVLNTTTGTEVAEVVLPSNVKGYAFLTDDVLAIATETGGVRLWEPGGTKVPRFIDPALLPANPLCVARSPDGTRWAVGGYEGVHVFSYPACELVAKSVTDLQVTKLHFSPDGKQLIGQTDARAVRHWDAATGKRVRTWVMPDVPVALAFTADGKGFFAAGASWVSKHRLDDDTPDTAFAPTFVGDNIFCDLRPSADGKTLRLLVGGKPGQVIELDPDGGKLLATLKQPDTVLVDYFSCLHPDDKTILGTRNGCVWRWDATTGVGPVFEPLGTLLRSAFAPDGRTVRTLSNGNVRYTWDAATGKPTADPTPMPDAIAWDHSLTRVAEAVGEKEVAVREVGTGRELARLPSPNPQAGAVFFQPDPAGDDLLATPSDKGKVFWDVARGRRVFTLPTACDRPVVLSAGRRTAFCPNRDPGWEIWETTSGRRRSAGTMNGGGDFVAEADGKHVWTLGRGADPNLVRVETATGKQVRTLRVERWGEILGVSADGRRFAAFNHAYETVLVYDTTTGHCTHRLFARGHTATHGEFNADGTRLVTSGVEGAAYVWDLSRPVPLVETPEPVSAFRDATAAVASLRGDDAAVAHLGMTWLHAHPADGLTALAAAYPPAVAVPAARLEQLLADRDSADFKTRLKADKELTKLGPLAEEALKAEAEKPRSEEVRAAVEVLLARLNAELPSGERLAELRAVEVVERVGTPEAMKVLTAWAAGAANATLTTEAKAVLARQSGK